MNDKTLGVRLVADAEGMIRAYRASGAASASFAVTTETSLNRAAAAATKVGSGTDGMTTSVKASEAAGKAYNLAGDRFVNTLERQAQALGKTRSQLLEMRAAELGVSAQAAPFIGKLREQEAALTKSGKSFDQYGISAAQTAAAMRGVPAQITDIVVSLQGGQAPLTVLLQQGGQLKDMFGGIVPAARALGTTVLGMVNPFTLLAVAGAGVGYAMYAGREENDRFNRSILMTGNYAGVTTSSIRGMAAAAATFSNGSLSSSRQAVEALLSTGQISQQTIESLSATMLRLQRVSGQSMTDISADYARMPEGVLKWAEEHNRSMNFMSLAQWDYIRSLEEAGDVQGAMQATSRSLHDYLGTEAAGKVGILERSWRGLKAEISGALEEMKKWGRDSTLSENIDIVEKRIQMREQRLSRGAISDINRRRTQMNLDADRVELTRLRGELDAENKLASEQSKFAQRNKAAIEAAKALDSLDISSDKKRQKEKALAENSRYESAIRAVNPDDDRISPKALKDREAATLKKFVDSGSSADRQNAISAQLAAMQAQSRLREEQLRQENARLEADRSRGMLSEEQFIQRRAQAQRAALQDELSIVQRQAEVAGGKKQLAERERYLGRAQELEAQIVRTYEQEAADIEKYLETIRGAVRATQLDIENFQQSRELQVGRQLSALTLGSNDQALVDAINQAQDRFRRIRDGFTDKMLREGGAGSLDSEQYLQGISQIDQAMRDQVRRERQYMAERLAMQGNWKNGATLALNQWVDSSANVMGQAQQLFSSVFSGLEGVVASFVVTGKAKFSDFTKSILADMVKISVRQATLGIVTKVAGSLFTLGAGAAAGTEAMASSVQSSGGDGIGSLIASNGWVVPNAKGNVYSSPSLSTYSNEVYNTPQMFAFAKGAGVFAEAGPEAIMPLKRGPDGSLGVRAEIPTFGAPASGASGDIHINTSIHLGEGGGSTQTQSGNQEGSVRQLGSLISEQIRVAIARETRVGGLIYNFRHGR